MIFRVDGFYTRAGSGLDPDQLLGVLRVVHFLAHRAIPELWGQLLAHEVEGARDSSDQLVWGAGREARRPLFGSQLYHTQGVRLSAMLRLDEVLCPMLATKGMRRLFVPPNSLQCTGRTEVCVHLRPSSREF